MSLAKTPTASRPQPEYISELLHRLGGVPANRVRLRPTPGTATERDVLAIRDHEDRLCELVDGVLVETMGYGMRCWRWPRPTSSVRRPRRLGIVALGRNAAVALGLVRMPDVSFISWNRLPDRRFLRSSPGNWPDLRLRC